MNDSSADVSTSAVEKIYREEARRVFASLIRLLGDFDVAEEALHDAFLAALECWTRDGIPANPRAWLVSTGRFKAIDAIRRRVKFDASLAEVANRIERSRQEPVDDDRLEDDQLRLIFTCCHPGLSLETQVALTLREVCGLKTEEIARAFLTSPTTIAQRIVRGKAKIRDAGIPYEVPVRGDLPERLESILAVIYLVFNEGYSASSGESVTRSELSLEAIRLGRLVNDLLPDPEVLGLLALMLFQESRRGARSNSAGELILLEHQNRDLWNSQFINEGSMLVDRAFAGGSIGAYSIQAAIAAVHAQAEHAADTDWKRIVTLYDLLLQASPSPIVELNRAVAIAMRDGPESGLVLIDSLLAEGKLQKYHLAHAARADLCRRLGRLDEARRSYEDALQLAQQIPEQKFLQDRLNQLHRER